MVLIDGIALWPMFGGTVPILRDPLVILNVTGITPLDAAVAYSEVHVVVPSYSAMRLITDRTL